MKSGTYIKSLAGYETYIPNDLPPVLGLAPATLRLIDEANYLLGRVETCRDLLPNANLLIYSSLQRESIASSTIEGTIASPDELVRFQASHHTERMAVREVDNYGKALEWGFEQLEVRDINTSFICTLHSILLDNARGDKNSGCLKVHQNAIGKRFDDKIEDAIFVPCPPERVEELMEGLQNYLTQDHIEAKVVQCALVHHQFETIHPFSDGNGRVGRLLIVLHMIKLGLLSAPLIYPSVFFEKTKNDYCIRLQAVRDDNDWDGWIAYFAFATIQACQETLRFTRTIKDLERSLHSQIANIRKRASCGEVINVFFEEPVLSVRQICERARISHKTAQSVLDELIDRKLVYEVTQKEKGRIYACEPILDAIFRSEKDN